MKYLVTARDWTESLAARFGRNGGEVHDLSDYQVVEAILRHGRASIDSDRHDYGPAHVVAARKQGAHCLHFENNYD